MRDVMALLLTCCPRKGDHRLPQGDEGEQQDAGHDLRPPARKRYVWIRPWIRTPRNVPITEP
jgi:hypothetical protein